MKKIPSWITLLGCEIIVVLILFLFGFKFTYAPELENSWGAISAFAAWASVIASSIAILVAVWIPKRIAEKQDRIALFEKRFEFYEELQRCISFSAHVQNLDSINEIQIYFLATFGENVITDSTYPAIHQALAPRSAKSLIILKRGCFLFDFEMSDEIENLTASLTALLHCSDQPQYLSRNRGNYLQAVENIRDSVIDNVEEQLKMK